MDITSSVTRNLQNPRGLIERMKEEKYCTGHQNEDEKDGVLCTCLKHILYPLWKIEARKMATVVEAEKTTPRRDNTKKKKKRRRRRRQKKKNVTGKEKSFMSVSKPRFVHVTCTCKVCTR
jgi:hypothetical protein